MRSLIAITALAFALSSPGQAQISRKLPASAGSSGNSQTPFFSGYGAGRLQQVVAGKAFCRSTAALREVRLRASGGNAIAGRSFSTLKFWLGYAKTTPTTISPTFANNRGAQTLVFNGKYSLPAQAANARPFNIVWKLTSPWLYQLNKGDLLLEWEVPGTPSKANYFFDAHQQKTSNGVALTFGKAGPFKTPERYKVTSDDLTKLRPGGAAILYVGPMTKSRPAIAIWGFSRTKYGALTLPFHLAPLGAKDNYLHISIDIAVGLPLKQGSSGWEGRSTLPIPAIPVLGGKSVYAQALFADAPSNAFGWVWSSAVDMQLGGIVPIETNHVGHWDPNAARAGFVSRTPIGVVVELFGVFI